MTTAPQNPLSPSGSEAGKNRRTGKAVLAGVVAVGLLAAGGGTFSKWYDEKAIAGDTTVTAGELFLSDVAPSTWTYADGAKFNPATDELVPGDTVVFTTTAKVNAEGKNLRGNLALQLPTDTSPAIESVVTMKDVKEKTGVGVSSYPITEENDNMTVQVTGTFTLPESLKDKQGQNEAEDLAGLKLVLAQR